MKEADCLTCQYVDFLVILQESERCLISTLTCASFYPEDKLLNFLTVGKAWLYSLKVSNVLCAVIKQILFPLSPQIPYLAFCGNLKTLFLNLSELYGINQVTVASCHLCKFCINRFNQMQMEKFWKKIGSVLNIYNFFWLSFLKKYSITTTYIYLFSSRYYK